MVLYSVFLSVQETDKTTVGLTVIQLADSKVCQRAVSMVAKMVQTMAL